MRQGALGKGGLGAPLQEGQKVVEIKAAHKQDCL